MLFHFYRFGKYKFHSAACTNHSGFAYIVMS